MTPKDLSKLSKEIRHERESYRELTGRYIEKPEAIPLKETHYSDLSNKESILKKESKKDSKSKEIKTKIKRSDSGRSELKVNVSVGSKVLIIEPLGVYDCINLGRRIDVQWPSEAERERGGRNFWGSWVPIAGMDGLVSDNYIYYIWYSGFNQMAMMRRVHGPNMRNAHLVYDGTDLCTHCDYNCI